MDSGATHEYRPVRSAWRSLLPVGLVVAAAVVTGLLAGSALTGDGGGSGTDRERSTRAEPRQRTRTAPPPVSGANAAGLNDQGFKLMNASRYEEAIPLLRRAVDTARDGSFTQAYALYNLGRSLRLAGRPDEAIPLLERRLGFPNQRETVARELAAARRAARDE